MSRYKYWNIFKIVFLIGVCSSVFFVAFIKNINMPFVGIHESTSLLFSGFAKLHIALGLNVTKLGAVTINPINSNIVFSYLYHPVLIHLMLSLPYYLIGLEDWVGRSYALIFSMGTLFYIYRLSHLLWNSRIAVYATLFGFFSPMFLIFGKLIEFSIPCLFFIIASIYYFCKWQKYGTNFYTFALFMILAFFTAWPGFYMVPALIMSIYFCNGKNENRRNDTLKILIIGCSGLIIVLSYIIYLTGIQSAISILTQKFSERVLSINVQESEKYSIFQWLFLITLRVSIYFTPIVTFMSGYLTLSIIKKIIRNKGFDFTDSILFCLFSIGFAHICLFNNAAWTHNFWLYYFIPYMSISAGITIEKISKLKKKACLHNFFRYSFVQFICHLICKTNRKSEFLYLF